MTVTPETAMRATAVHACVQYLARSTGPVWQCLVVREECHFQADLN
jgi:phage portal protein BeeE